jgi:lipopolysaccharide heptosyltransferase II
MRIPEKILIIRFSSLGDILLASPLLRVLHRSFPRARVDFLLKAEYADLVRYHPAVSSVLALPSAGSEDLSELRRQIRAERYDVILDLHNSLRSRAVRFFSGARRVFSVNKRVIRRFMLVNLKRNFYREVVPVAERYLETVAPLGLAKDNLGLELYVPDETISRVATMMSRYKLDRFDVVIGMAPSARHATKRWPPERFRELGVRLVKERRAKLLLFGGPEETDYCGDIAQMINAEAGSSSAESLAGKLSLLETAAALDHCTLMISNDSGLMHMAAARGRRVLAIFGSTVREFGFFPYGTPAAILEAGALPCRPCSHIGRESCPEGHFRCMKDISVEEAFSAVRSIAEEAL